MARKQFDLIVFDWDGTLMDSTATIVASMQAAARDLGLPVPDDRAASHVIGLGLQDAMQAVLPDLDPKSYPRMVERYRYHYLAQDQTLTLFDGVREMLADLASQGYFLAVATGALMAFCFWRRIIVVNPVSLLLASGTLAAVVAMMAAVSPRRPDSPISATTCFNGGSETSEFSNRQGWVGLAQSSSSGVGARLA
jgi:hypothetical protein